MQFFVETSSGELLQTDSREQYVSWLDEHGPEVVYQFESPDEEDVRPTPTVKQVAYVNAAIDLLPEATLHPAMDRSGGEMLLIVEEPTRSRYGKIDADGKLVGASWF